MRPEKLESDFLRYIVSNHFQPGDRLPPLNDISVQMGISVGKLREELEVARLLGLVDIRPRVGISVKDYSFRPAVRTSMMFALAQSQSTFQAFGELRNCVEVGFWKEAAGLLKPEDKQHLQALVNSARAKLNGTPIQIPHGEHRELHLAIFRRLNNPFVLGVLEAYWEAYEAVGLNVFADLRYLQEVWDYHAEMVAAIVNGDLEAGHRAFVEHLALLREREEIQTKEIIEPPSAPVLELAGVG